MSTNQSEESSLARSTLPRREITGRSDRGEEIKDALKRLARALEALVGHLVNKQHAEPDYSMKWNSEHASALSGVQMTTDLLNGINALTQVNNDSIQQVFRDNLVIAQNTDLAEVAMDGENNLLGTLVAESQRFINSGTPNTRSEAISEWHY